MRNAIVTAALLFAALGARAELEMLGPLSAQIQNKTITEDNGGVTAAVGVGSGQSVKLEFADMAAPFAAHMAPAVSAPDRPLKPAPELMQKKAKKKKKKSPKTAKEKLHYVDEKKNWGEKP